MKARKGKWPGGSRPYGYHVDRETQRLTPHPGESPHLREIFRLFTQDRQGTRAIADELNQRGVANRTGKPWSGVSDPVTAKACVMQDGPHQLA